MFKKVCCGSSLGAKCGGKMRTEVVEVEAKSHEEDDDEDGVEVSKGKWKRKGKEVKSGPKYKLIYFNARVGGEAIRYIFHKAGVPFEDKRIEGDEWPSLKPQMKWGKLPVLEVEGHQIYSSSAISRFLAKRFRLTGKNEIEGAKCDEIVNICQDLKHAWSIFHFANENDKDEHKANFLNMIKTYFPKFNMTIEDNPRSGGEESSCWLVSSDCTWADIFLANLLEVWEDTLDKGIVEEYPALGRMKNAVFSIPEIKKYVESRPQTLF